MMMKIRVLCNTMCSASENFTARTKGMMYALHGMANIHSYQNVVHWDPVTGRHGTISYIWGFKCWHRIFVDTRMHYDCMRSFT